MPRGTVLLNYISIHPYTGKWFKERPLLYVYINVLCSIFKLHNKQPKGYQHNSHTTDNRLLRWIKKRRKNKSLRMFRLKISLSSLPGLKEFFVILQIKLMNLSNTYEKHRNTRRNHFQNPIRNKLYNSVLSLVLHNIIIHSKQCS